MKASEVVKEIQRLIDREGDKDFHIYLSFSKQTREPNESNICYDDAEDDIYIGVYG